jgi:P-type Cu2+ transporter
MQTTSENAIAPSHSNRETFTLDVKGMKCAGCVKAVETQLTRQPGVITAAVNLVTELATVECETGVSPATLADKLTEAGFPTSPRLASSEFNQTLLADPAEQQRSQTQQLIRQVALAATLLVLSAIGHIKHFGWVTIPVLSDIWFHWGLATLSLIGPGRPIIIDGWRGLRQNMPNMNTLVGLGTLTAYAASLIALLFPMLGWECFFDEPVMLLGFILLGRTLEQHARSRATSALHSLLALRPTIARLIQADSKKDAIANFASASVEIPADQVKIGQWLQVLPGEKIPVDGEVVAGQTTVNEAMLTGEAIPVLKQPHDFVAAGSLNLSGAIAIKATRTGNNTTLAQIIALVEAAQTRKAPIQGLADLVAGYFTYGVMAIALLTFLFWYFIGIPLWGSDWMVHGTTMLHSHLPASAPMPVMALHTPLLLSLKLAIAVLVIACPCALGLATPTAILVGSGIGAEQGLLIRGGDVLEKVHHLTTVMFDKTGTLTTGQPIVTDCIVLNSTLNSTQLLQLAATVESGTQHPLSVAIRRQAEQAELPLLPAQAFQTKAGYGVSARVAEQLVILGTQNWLEQQGILVGDEAQTQAQTLATDGKTVIFVAIDHTLIGLIAVQDQLRPDARQTVERLQQRGLQVLLLTGDQQTTAAAIAQSINLPPDALLANVRPEDKVEAIRHLQQQGQRVAMVGDGINDAPALAQADVGISMHSGTDVAIDTAEIILMRDRLSDVVESIRLSSATFNKIQQNLFWAFAYNIVGIPIAAGVLLPLFGIVLSPATAGALMAFSSISVVTNSLLLRYTYSPKA